MRKVTLITVILIFISSGLIQAQITQGKVLIGLNTTFGLVGTGNNIMTIGYSETKTKSDVDNSSEPDVDKTMGFNLTPSVGLMLSEYFAVGLNFHTAFLKFKSGTAISESTYTEFSAGPFVRAYIPAGNVKPYFLFDGSLGTTIYNQKYDNDSRKTNYSLNSLGGGIGVAIPLGSAATFDILGSYQYVSQQQIEDNPENYRSVTGSIGLTLGLTVYL